MNLSIYIYLTYIITHLDICMCVNHHLVKVESVIHSKILSYETIKEKVSSFEES